MTKWASNWGSLELIGSSCFNDNICFLELCVTATWVSTSFGWLVIKNKHLEDVTLGSGSHFSPFTDIWETERSSKNTFCRASNTCWNVRGSVWILNHPINDLQPHESNLWNDELNAAIARPPQSHLTRQPCMWLSYQQVLWKTHHPWNCHWEIESISTARAKITRSNSLWNIKNKVLSLTYKRYATKPEAQL